MNVINSQVSNAHLHGYFNHEMMYAIRLPDGTQFGNRSSFGGSWGALVADIVSQI